MYDYVKMEQTKQSVMKEYKTILVKTEEITVKAENINDAVRKATRRAKELGMEVVDVVDGIKPDEEFKYKLKAIIE